MPVPTKEAIIAVLEDRGVEVVDLSSGHNVCLEIETSYSFRDSGGTRGGWFVRLMSTSPPMDPKMPFEVFVVEWNKDDVKYHRGMYHKLLPEWHTAQSIASWMTSVQRLVND